MLDRSASDAARWRVAICAFEYYPTKHLDEPGWHVHEDVEWCLEPLAELPADQLDELRRTIEELIMTPTADRQRFIRHLETLTAGNEPPDEH